jgi:rifampicin phosphotransferase
MTPERLGETASGEDRAAAGVYLVPLRLAPGAGISKVGAKALRLGELERAGFPIPPGIVLVSSALDRFLSANGMPSAPTPEQVLAGELPGDLAEALRAAAAALGPGPLAVRSSGASEDSGYASFAGLYESVLGVADLPTLVAAVRRCWASAFSPRVLAYRAGRSLGDLRFAVLIQRQVEADAAGVAFTVNPVSGDPAEVLVSAVRGLGERLVSGEASPDEWVVRGARATCRRAPEEAIDGETAVAVAELARRIERRLGTPQDVEWVLERGRLAVVQARPITALPPAPARAVPPGRWEREPTHYPRPLSPLARSLVLPAANEGLRRAFEEFGFLPETLELREIGGWVYQRLVPPGGKDRRPPPRWLMPLAVRAVPAIRRRVRRAVQAVRSDLSAELVERWHSFWRPRLRSRIDELRRVDLEGRPDEEVARHLRGAADLLRESTEVHMKLHGALALSIAALVFACRELGWDDAEALELLSGLSTSSTEPARRLGELAAIIRSRGDLDALVGDDGLERLARADPSVDEALRRYRDEFGMRALRYELADPTLAESPALLGRLVRDQLAREYDPAGDEETLAERRRRALSRAYEALAQRSGPERDRFERALAAARRAYPVREENQLLTIAEPLGLVRCAALEAGRSLASRGLLANRDEVFLLELEEVLAALAGAPPARDLVASRRGEREAALSGPGPQAYGPEPAPPPPLDALPPEARFANEAMRWAIERIFAPALPARAPVDGVTLRGIPASPGEYVGTARVIHGEDELGKLLPGDVLVCRVTSPVWSIVFPTVGALVTDAGGILSHPAIIAREYRIPAVVATGHATRALRDGDRVRVDGTLGEVTPAR